MISQNLGYPTFHIQVHDQIKPFKCEECGKEFARSYKMKLHIQSVHEGKSLFPCDQCDASFSESNKLKRHITGVHLNIKPFPCVQCESQFYSLSMLKEHIAIAHEEGDYSVQCNICFKNYKHTESLNSHIKTVHEGRGSKKFSCE